MAHPRHFLHMNAICTGTSSSRRTILSGRRASKPWETSQLLRIPCVTAIASPKRMAGVTRQNTLEIRDVPGPYQPQSHSRVCALSHKARRINESRGEAGVLICSPPLIFVRLRLEVHMADLCTQEGMPTKAPPLAADCNIEPSPTLVFKPGKVALRFFRR
jgi:hypothetical protein